MEGPAHGRDPGGSGEAHVLEVGADGAALGAAEPTHGLTARLVILTKGAAYPGQHGDLRASTGLYDIAGPPGSSPPVKF
jgi:hypothetical protein